MNLIIADTEFTAWEGSMRRNWSEPWEYREIIQVAALRVRLDGDGLYEAGQFNELVQPRLNPRLSKYIQTLTGITQSVVDDYGVDFPSCYRSFLDFCGSGALLAFWGRDDRILAENLLIHGLGTMPDALRVIDLQDCFERAGHPAARLNSGALAGHFGLSLAGHEHNALHDVRSLLMALEQVRRQGVLDVRDCLDSQSP
jgi:inhibitor of KinA sporulation pathway (predicted exonuclease)